MKLSLLLLLIDLKFISEMHTTYADVPDEGPEKSNIIIFDSFCSRKSNWFGEIFNARRDLTTDSNDNSQ